MEFPQPDAQVLPATQTALVVVVPAVEELVDPVRQRLDAAAAWGVPAHVTVLYPFVPPADLDDQLLATLAEVVASVDAFDVTFATTGWFDQDVLWLAPEPAAPFRALTAAVWTAFPDHPPYGGAFDGSSPHLTLAERRLGDLAALHEAERAVRAGLPLHAHVDRVHLIAGSPAPESWQVMRILRLGRASD